MLTCVMLCLVVTVMEVQSAVVWPGMGEGATLGATTRPNRTIVAGDTWGDFEWTPPRSRGKGANHTNTDNGVVAVEGEEYLEEETPWKAMHDKSFKIRPWPGARVPYILHGSSKAKNKVEAALRNIEKYTCVNFTARAGEARYLHIKAGAGKCWTSSLGYPSYNKKVTVNLGPGCVHPGKIKHEILHALGFPHEHARPDRNTYVAVKWTNIKSGSKAQFKINHRYPTPEVPYDLFSIMHYGRRTFAKDSSEATLIPVAQVKGKIGNKKLSYRDKRKVNVFYGCL